MSHDVSDWKLDGGGDDDDDCMLQRNGCFHEFMFSK
jgi:hypothetical protein